MQEGIGRRCDAERAPRQNDAGIVEDALCRRDRQRDEQKSQGPVAGLVDGLGDRAGAEIVGRRLVGDPKRRRDRATKATTFTGDQRPDRSRRNGMSGPLQRRRRTYGRKGNAQSNDTRGSFISDHDLKSPAAPGWASSASAASFSRDGEHPWARAQSIGRNGRGDSEQGARCLLETRPVAGHDGHEPVGGLLRLADTVLAPVRASCHLNELAQCDRCPSGLGIEPIPMPRQQRDFARDDAKFRAAGATRSVGDRPGVRSACASRSTRPRRSRGNPPRWDSLVASSKIITCSPLSTAALALSATSASSPAAMQRAPLNAVQWV